MKKINRKRKTACVFAAAVMSAALLGVSVYPAWAGYENIVEKISLFPDNVTVDSPTELGNISLPESDYGIYSWCAEAYIPSKRVETCRVKLKPFYSVDLSGYSGWDEEEGVLIGKVTVVTLSYESDEPEYAADEQSRQDYEEETAEETTEQATIAQEITVSAESAVTQETSVSGESAVTQETSASGETAVTQETSASAESAVTEDTTVSTEDAAVMETAVSTEDAAAMETAVFAEDAVTEETTDFTETVVTEEPADFGETAVTQETAISEETAVTEETADPAGTGTAQTEEIVISEEISAADETKNAEESTAAQESQSEEASAEGEAAVTEETTEETSVQESDAPESSAQTASETAVDQPELPGAELLVPLIPSESTAESTESAEITQKPEISEEVTLPQEEAIQEESGESSTVFEEKLSEQEQAAQAAVNHICAGITVSGADLPWYVQFQVSDGNGYQFSNEEGAAVFSSYEFRLWDLKNNTEYEIPDGQYISVTIPVKEGYTYTIEHILDNGAIESIVPTVSDGVMVFSTHSFSPFGIAGTKLLVGEEIAEKTYSNTTTKATPTPTSKITPTSKVTPTPTKSASGTSASGTSGSGSAGTSTSGNSGTGSSGSGSSAAGTSGSDTSGTGSSATGTSNSGTSASSGTAQTSGSSQTGSSSGTGTVNTDDDTPTGFFGLLAAAAAGIAVFTAALKRKEKE